MLVSFAVVSFERLVDAHAALGFGSLADEGHEMFRARFVHRLHRGKGTVGTYDELGFAIGSWGVGIRAMVLDCFETFAGTRGGARRSLAAAAAVALTRLGHLTCGVIALLHLGPDLYQGRAGFALLSLTFTAALPLLLFLLFTGPLFLDLGLAFLFLLHGKFLLGAEKSLGSALLGTLHGAQG